MDFSRKELIEIREEAQTMADNVLSQSWIRAYQALADAADKLDAMNARCTVEEGQKAKKAA